MAFDRLSAIKSWSAYAAFSVATAFVNTPTLLILTLTSIVVGIVC